MRTVSAIVVAIAMTLEMTIAPVFAQEAPVITKIVVEGNQHVATDTILAAVTSKVGEPYASEQVEKDGQAIYDLGWFVSVRPKAEPEAGGTKITFVVKENEVIDGVCFKGRTLHRGKPVFSDEQLIKAMAFQPGQVRNNKDLERQVDAIERLYLERGYTYATVIDIITEERAVNDNSQYVICFVIAEGVVEDITIKGQRKTRPYVIRRELDTKPGDLYNANRVQRDVHRLFNLELFEDVRATTLPGNTPGALILQITVEERKTGVASVGMGWSSVQKLVGFADYADTNFRGSGRRISLRLQFGGRQGGEIGYFDPWFAANRTGLNVGVYNKLTQRQAFTSTGSSFLYDEKRAGGSVTISRPLSSATTGFLTLRDDTVEPRNIEDEDLTPEELETLLGGRTNVRSVAFALVNDTRDFIRAPTRGGYNSLSVEVAGILGGESFNKLGSDVRRYFKVGGSHVIAARLMAGWITGSAPFLEQFLLGGANNLRGYEEDQFPGSKMLLLNVEYRFPLGNKLTGVTFVDVGDAWSGAYAADRGLGDASFSAHVGYGVGIRVTTPIGPIRLDLGFGEEGAQTHFSIGHMF